MPVANSVKNLFILPKLLLPETKERTLFEILIALLLPLNFIAIKVISLPIICKSTLLSNNFLQKAVVLAMPVILIFVISWSELLALMTGGINTYWLPACLTFMLAAVV